MADLQRAGVKGAPQLLLVSPDHPFQIIHHHGAHRVMLASECHTILP